MFDSPRERARPSMKARWLEEFETDVILAEGPSYVGALGTFLSYQAEVVHVAGDDDGLDPEALRETSRRLKAEGKRISNWLADGVIKYHRTLGTYLNVLIAAGFEIRRVEEWGPTAAQIAANPALAEEAERPMLLLVSAYKPLA